MLTDEIITEMKTRGTYLVPTTYLVEAIDLSNLPAPVRAKAEFILPHAVDSLRRAIAAGVKIAYGTDAAVYPHGDNAREFAVLVERGMSPLEAIRSATIHSADLLGVADRGRLNAGLLADVIAVPGNPLEDIRVMEEVVFVMKDGNVYKQP
jgi:imidazolonepropionase-like amidohydrolase